jgi:hypothetical protein
MYCASHRYSSRLIGSIYFRCFATSGMTLPRGMNNLIAELSPNLIPCEGREDFAS